MEILTEEQYLERKASVEEQVREGYVKLIKKEMGEARKVAGRKAAVSAWDSRDFRNHLYNLQRYSALAKRDISEEVEELERTYQERKKIKWKQ
jgi:hypothetical protein